MYKNVEDLAPKILSEEKSKKNMLSNARALGCEKEMLMLYAKTYKLLNNCTNEKERKDIAKLAIVEAYRLLGGGGELYIDGQLVCKDD